MEHVNPSRLHMSFGAMPGLAARGPVRPQKGLGARPKELRPAKIRSKFQSLKPAVATAPPATAAAPKAEPRPAVQDQARAKAGPAHLALRLAAWIRPRARPARDVLAELAEAAKFSTIVNRIGNISPLSETEELAIRTGTPNRRMHQAGSDLVAEGDPSPRPMFVSSGWAARLRTLPNGRTQIIGFFLPGDAIAIKGCGEPHASTTISALTTLETVDASRVLRFAGQPQTYPGVSHALSRLCVQDEEFLINQVTRLGALSIEARFAHLLLELRWRLCEAGLATEREFMMPLTLETLAETMGVRRKDVQRVVGRFRHEGLIRFRYGRVELLRPQMLEKLSGFAPPSPCACEKH